jgi:hypothetical protein
VNTAAFAPGVINTTIAPTAIAQVASTANAFFILPSNPSRSVCGVAPDLSYLSHLYDAEWSIPTAQLPKVRKSYGFVPFHFLEQSTAGRRCTPGTPRSSAFDAALKRERPEDAAEQFACAVNLN